MVSRNPNHGILENSHSQADMGNTFEENVSRDLLPFFEFSYSCLLLFNACIQNRLLNSHFHEGMEDSKNTATSMTLIVTARNWSFIKSYLQHSVPQGANFGNPLWVFL